MKGAPQDMRARAAQQWNLRERIERDFKVDNEDILVFANLRERIESVQEYVQHPVD